MKEFFLMLFFAKTIVLTPAPINLNKNWIEIKPKKPLCALNLGATIYIDISEYAKGKMDIKFLDYFLPPGTITAKLIAHNGDELIMLNGSAYSFEDNKVEVIMLNRSKIYTSTEYTKVLINSKKKLNNITIRWRNSNL